MTPTTTDSLPSLPFARSNPLEPADELARLRADAPVSRVRSTTGEPAWLVTRYDDARTVLGDRRLAVALPGVASGDQGVNDSLFQDPPGHTRLRRLVSAAFTAHRVATLRSRTAGAAAELVGDMAVREPPIDLMEAFAFPLPITVIGELLGIPATGREDFRSWSNALMSLPGPGGRTDQGAGWQNITDQVTDAIATSATAPTTICFPRSLACTRPTRTG